MVEDKCDAKITRKKGGRSNILIFFVDRAATWPPLGLVTLITGEIIAICPLAEMKAVSCGCVA